MQPGGTNRLVSRRRFLAGAAAAVVAVPAAMIPARYRGEIYPGAIVRGVRIGGLSPEQALATLHAGMTGFEQHAATFHFEEHIWSATLAELGGSIDYEATLDLAISYGRESLSSRYTSFFAADGSRDIPLVMVWNEDVAAEYLRGIAPAIDIEARNARLYRSQGQIQMVESEVGRRLAVEQALQDIHDVVMNHRFAAIDLAAETVLPTITSEDLSINRDEAVQLIGEPVVLTHGNLKYPVSAEQLAQALIIDSSNHPQIDADRLSDRLDAIAADMYVPPVNVKLGWDNGLHVVANDVAGLRMDRKATQALIVKLAKSPERTAVLPTQTAPAAARADNVHELGLETHLAWGGSSFEGSSWERATNVAVAASNISYQLIAPGEMFSFNKLIGPITEDMGYVSGQIINGDWTETDIGGGVCQVSTTVFRAAAKAGFRFNEWHSHTWRVSFYELDGSPPGFDAAIYQPNGPGQMELDLKFTNTLDSWLLLMMVVEGGMIYAHFYGKDPGWTVTIGDVRVSDPIQADKPTERVNPALAKGDRRWVRGSAPGYVVRLHRTVVAADGTMIADGDFVSNYLPQPEVWEVGPK